jgi:hypothetical protein
VRGQSVVAALVLVAGLSGARSGNAASLEYKVKAAFLYNFTKFVEWPPQAFAGPAAPYALCVLGSDPFAEDLDLAAADKTVQGRPITIRRLSDLKGTAGCHILFVSLSERGKLATVFAALGAAPTLTVGEADDFTRAGGCVRLFVEDNRVRLEINLQAADRARLKVSAKLLSVARVVGKPGGRSP